MAFGFFKRRRERHRLGMELETIQLPETTENEGSDIEQGSAPMEDRLERLMESAREIDESKKEYRVITSYLNDIEIIENLAADRSEDIRKAAESMTHLNEVRDQFLNTSRKISDAQFQMMQQDEDRIPDVITRFNENEEYQHRVKRDMQYLEGEKQQIELRKEELRGEQNFLQKISKILMSVVIVVAVMLFVLFLGFDLDVTYAWIAVIALAFSTAAYILIRLQNIDREIRQSDVNINYAIVLLNKVKIKYVNITNAVDYMCEKYHVENARELSYQWDMYIEAVKEQERYRQTNEDLNYYYNRLLSLLKKCNLYDSRIWLEQPQGLADQREMVEIKHNLLVRRKKLRSRISYNLDIVRKEREDIRKLLKKEKVIDPKIRDTIQTIDQLSGLTEEP